MPGVVNGPMFAIAGEDFGFQFCLPALLSGVEPQPAVKVGHSGGHEFPRFGVQPVGQRIIFVGLGQTMNESAHQLRRAVRQNERLYGGVELKRMA